MTLKISAFSLLLGLLFLTSCSHQMNIFGEPNSDYHKIVKRELRKKTNINIEKTKYQTFALRKTLELRQAYVDHYAEKFRLSPEEKSTLLQKELSAAEQFEEFVIYHYATNPKTSQLKKENGAWNIQLESGNQRLKPVSVVALKGDKVILRYFNPAMTPWSQNYRVRFDKPTSQGSPTLMLDNVDGSLTFNW